jgi:hypothetical protein
MLSKLKTIPEEFWNYFLKVILVAFVAIGIKIAVQIKREKMSVMNGILSVFIGVGVAILCGGYILHAFPGYWATIMIAFVTIIGEKLATWLIYEFKVDKMMEDFVLYLTRKK